MATLVGDYAVNCMNQGMDISFENWSLDKMQELFQSLQGMEECRVTLTFGAKEPNDRITEKALVKHLARLGFAPHLRGYAYLKTGIRRCLESPHEMESVTKLLYPAIAKEHETTAARVEHGIRHAIALAWEGRDEEEWGFIFGFRKSHRPTNSEFLAALTDYIHMVG